MKLSDIVHANVRAVPGVRGARGSQEPAASFGGGARELSVEEDVYCRHLFAFTSKKGDRGRSTWCLERRDGHAKRLRADWYCGHGHIGRGVDHRDVVG